MKEIIKDKNIHIHNDQDLVMLLAVNENNAKGMAIELEPEDAMVVAKKILSFLKADINQQLNGFVDEDLFLAYENEQLLIKSIYPHNTQYEPVCLTKNEAVKVADELIAVANEIEAREKS